MPARIIPAFAGSTPSPPHGSWRRRDHPRVRGEHASPSWVTLVLAGSSPRSRGALLLRGLGAVELGIIPAFAGSTSPPSCIRLCSGDHPRVRGEHVIKLKLDPSATGSSPRSRGAHGGRQHLREHRGIIPAFAGSTVEALDGVGREGDHPRVRGEHTLVDGDKAPIEGSSPRSRGARFLLWFPIIAAGIIPAFAGSTMARDEARAIARDHPRVRGEHSALIPAILAKAGSSPRSRGARACAVVRGGARGIIPAFAGSTGSRFATSVAQWDHPRVRGEHASTMRRAEPTAGSSPRSRGAQARRGAGDQGRGIIPAFAGSTARPSGESRRAGDHPRVRGEHISAMMSTMSR